MTNTITYTEHKHDNRIFHVFDNSDSAWNALNTTHTIENGWRIGCYGEFENCCWKADNE
jgi:hypothetical protein